MYHKQWWRKLYGTPLVVVYLVATVTAGAFGWAAAYPENPTPVWVNYMQRWSLLIVPTAAAIATIAGLLQVKTGSASRWGSIHRLLSALRQQIFQEELARGDPDHHHRVTLFRKCRFSNWLVPVERSGDSTMTSFSRFRAPDDTPDQATGVAGKCFYIGGILPIEELPDISSDANPEAADLADYARRSWCDVDYLRQRQPLARSFIGQRVVVNQKPWGVLIVDSREPNAKTADTDLRAYALTVETLGILLA